MWLKPLFARVLLVCGLTLSLVVAIGVAADPSRHAALTTQTTEADCDIRKS